MTKFVDFVEKQVKEVITTGAFSIFPDNVVDGIRSSKEDTAFHKAAPEGTVVVAEILGDTDNGTKFNVFFFGTGGLDDAGNVRIRIVDAHIRTQVNLQANLAAFQSTDPDVARMRVIAASLVGDHTMMEAAELEAHKAKLQELWALGTRGFLSSFERSPYEIGGGGTLSVPEHEIPHILEQYSVLQSVDNVGNLRFHRFERDPDQPVGSLKVTRISMAEARKLSPRQAPTIDSKEFDKKREEISFELQTGTGCLFGTPEIDNGPKLSDVEKLQAMLQDVLGPDSGVNVLTLGEDSPLGGKGNGSDLLN